MSREFNRYVEKQFALCMKQFDLEPAKAAGPIAWPAGTREKQLPKLEKAAVPAIADPLIEDALRTIELVGLPLAAHDPSRVERFGNLLLSAWAPPSHWRSTSEWPGSRG